MANRIVGDVITSPAPADLLIINRGGNLNEMLVNAVGINHMELTNTVDNVNTYTIYRSEDDTVPFGTFETINGENGAGNSIPDWANDTTYTLRSTVMYLGFLCRCTIAESLNHAPLTIATTAPFAPTMHASWEVVPLSGTDLVHVPSKNYTTDHVVAINGRLYSPFTNITATEANPVPFVVGYAADQWYSIGTGLIPYHNAAETVEVDTFRRFEDAYYQANSDIAGATTEVPFIIGTEENQWRVAGLPNNPHIPSNDYVINAQVIVNNILYTANSAITGATEEVPFSVGTARNQWRILGEANNGHDPLTDYAEDAVVRVGNIYYQNNTAGVRDFSAGNLNNQWRILGTTRDTDGNTISISGATYTVTSSDSDRELHASGTGVTTLTFVSTALVGGETYTVTNTGSGTVTALNFIGFNELYVRGRNTILPITVSTINLRRGETVRISITEDGGDYQADAVYSTGEKGWVRAESYHIGEVVIGSDGLTYEALQAIPAESARVITGFEAPWKLANSAPIVPSAIPVSGGLGRTLSRQDLTRAVMVNTGNCYLPPDIINPGESIEIFNGASTLFQVNIAASIHLRIQGDRAHSTDTLYVAAGESLKLTSYAPNNLRCHYSDGPRRLWRAGTFYERDEVVYNEGIRYRVNNGQNSGAVISFGILQGDCRPANEANPRVLHETYQLNFVNNNILGSAFFTDRYLSMGFGHMFVPQIRQGSGTVSHWARGAFSGSSSGGLATAGLTSLANTIPLTSTTWYNFAGTTSTEFAIPEELYAYRNNHGQIHVYAADTTYADVVASYTFNSYHAGQSNRTICLTRVLNYNT